MTTHPEAIRAEHERAWADLPAQLQAHPGIKRLNRAALAALNALPAGVEPVAQEAADEIMSQAQVFASAWSLVGGGFDSGDGLERAEEAKAELRRMVSAACTTPPAQPSADEQVAALQEVCRKVAQVLADYGHGPKYGQTLWAAVAGAIVASQPAAQRDGWQWVPKEPTPEMPWAGVTGMDAASHSDIDPTPEEVAATYRAMLAAAPKG